MCNPVDELLLTWSVAVTPAFAHWVSQDKVFGPNMGVLYGKYDLLDRLTAIKVRPAPQEPPGRGESQTRPYETGTGDFDW